MMFADAKHNIKTRHVVDLLMRLPVVFFKDEANDDGHIQHSHKIICYCVKQAHCHFSKNHGGGVNLWKFNKAVILQVVFVHGNGVLRTFKTVVETPPPRQEQVFAYANLIVAKGSFDE